MARGAWWILLKITHTNARAKMIYKLMWKFVHRVSLVDMGHWKSNHPHFGYSKDSRKTSRIISLCNMSEKFKERLCHMERMWRPSYKYIKDNSIPNIFRISKVRLSLNPKENWSLSITLFIQASVSTLWRLYGLQEHSSFGQQKGYRSKVMIVLAYVLFGEFFHVKWKSFIFLCFYRIQNHNFGFPGTVTRTRPSPGSFLKYTPDPGRDGSTRPGNCYC